MIFAFVVYIFSNIFTVYVEPWGFRSFKKLVFEIGKSKISTGIQPGLFNEDFYNLVSSRWVKEKADNQSQRFNIKHFDDGGEVVLPLDIDKWENLKAKYTKEPTSW